MIMSKSLQLALCDTQGQLFELAAERGYSSEAFIKAFMTSQVAADMDKDFHHVQWAGKAYILSRMEDELANRLTKNGEIYESRSKVISTEEFKVIQDYVMGQVKQEGQAIYEGVVTVNPYQMDKKTACEYCPYSGICGIDSKLPGYEKRILEKVDKDTILDRMLLQNKIQES